MTPTDLQQILGPGVELNPEQLTAVTHQDGPLMVIAGPGSGKTRVITTRTAGLILSGIDPRRILVLTFTRAAAREMKGRLSAIPALQNRPLQGLMVATFHSLFYRLLANFQSEPRTCTEPQRRRWVEQALKALGEEVKEDLVLELLGAIGYAKNNLQTISDLPKSQSLLADVWRAYEEQKSASGLVDFDDLLTMAYEMLRDDPNVRQTIQERWAYVLVDEFQDTSRVQFEALQLLAAPQNNLCVVGDMDQAIYAWRAASPEFLLRFGDLYPQAKQVVLSANYRTVPPIIEAANRLIAHNRVRHPVVIRPTRTGGTAPHHLTPANDNAEAKVVLTMVKRLHDEGIPYEEMAVLYRINNQSQVLVDQMVEQEIPFIIRDQSASLYDHWVARELLAFFRLLIDPTDPESLALVARRRCNLGEEEAGALRLLVGANRSGFWDDLQMAGALQSKLEGLGQDLSSAKGLTPALTVAHYLNRLGFADYLRRYAKRRGLDENSFVEMAEEIQARAEEYADIASFLQHVDRVRSVVRQSSGDQERPGAVNLMTLHGAKGLEFRAVWIIGVIKGLLPHLQSQSPQQIEEERRLFYVGCTRAKDQLFILSPQSYRFTKAELSPFVHEALGRSAPRAASSITRSINPVPKSHNGTKNQKRVQIRHYELPEDGATIKHKSFGIGFVLSCERVDDGGSDPYHRVEVQFASRQAVLNWEQSCEMGAVSIHWQLPE